MVVPLGFVGKGYGLDSLHSLQVGYVSSKKLWSFGYRIESDEPNRQTTHDTSPKPKPTNDKRETLF